MHWLWKNLRLHWKTELPWTFSQCWNIFYISGFLSNLHLPWKREFALKFFTASNIFFTNNRILSNLRLPWKTVCPEFTVLNIYFLTCRILSNFRLPWKAECALMFSTAWNIFYHSGFLRNLHLPWKREFALQFCTVLNVFFTIHRIFEQLALALKSSVPWSHCMEYIFFDLQNFEKLPLALKFYNAWNIFYHSGCLTNLRLPWKQSLPWNFSLHWNIFYISGFLSNLHLPWKTVCPEFTVLNIYFLTFKMLTNLRLPWKAECALKFFTVGLQKYFLSFRIFEQLVLALKTKFALKIFTVLNILFAFRIFEQLALALKNRVRPEFTVLNIGLIFLLFRILSIFRLPWKTEHALKFFTALKYFLYFRICEQLALALKNRVCPELIHCSEYLLFIIQSFEQFAFALKNRVCSKIFPCIELFFIIQDFWASCACPENRVCPEFFKPGGRPPPWPPASYATARRIKLLLKREANNETSFTSLRSYYQISYYMQYIYLLYAVYILFKLKTGILHEILTYINVYICIVGTPPSHPLNFSFDPWNE